MNFPYRRLLLTLLVLPVFFATASAAQAKPPRDFVGMSAEDVVAGPASYRAEGLGQQRSSGIGLLRMNFDWSGIERSRGKYSLAFYDANVGAAARKGIRIMPVMFNPPAFRSTAPRHGAKRGVYPPRRISSMAKFARVLVRRYGRKGSFWRTHPGVPKLPIRSWQVWNEPTLPVYWRPRPNPRRYASMLRGVSRAIRKIDHHAEIVTAGLPPSKLRGSIRLTSFIKRMYAAGAKSGFNTLAVNAYANNTHQLGRTVRAVRRVMRRNGDRKARLWITEIGWASTGPKHRFNVGFQGQAKRIKGSIAWIGRNRKHLRLRGFVYFQWHDQAPYTGKDMWGLHTGLLDRAGADKPARGAFSEAAHKLYR